MIQCNESMWKYQKKSLFYCHFEHKDFFYVKLNSDWENLFYTQIFQMSMSDDAFLLLLLLKWRDRKKPFLTRWWKFHHHYVLFLDTIIKIALIAEIN